MQPSLDRLGMPQEDLPCLGQRDGSRPPRAIDQLQADDTLERCDLLRDGGLRVPEPIRCAPERSGVGDGLERDEMTEVEPEPTIRFHDRSLN